MSETEATCARCREAQPDLIAGYDGRQFCSDCCEMAGGASMPRFLRSHDRVCFARLGRPRWQILVGAAICTALVVTGIALGARAFETGAVLVGLVAAGTLVAGSWVGLRVGRRDAEFDGWSITFDRREHPGRIHFVQRARSRRILFDAWGDFARLVEWLDRRREHLEDQQLLSADLTRCVALAYLHTPGNAAGAGAPFPTLARSSDIFRAR